MQLYKTTWSVSLWATVECKKQDKQKCVPYAAFLVKNDKNLMYGIYGYLENYMSAEKSLGRCILGCAGFFCLSRKSIPYLPQPALCPGPWPWWAVSMDQCTLWLLVGLVWEVPAKDEKEGGMWGQGIFPWLRLCQWWWPQVGAIPLLKTIVPGGGPPDDHSLCFIIFIFGPSSLEVYLLLLHQLLLVFLGPAHTFKIVPLIKSPWIVCMSVPSASCKGPDSSC